MIEKEPKDCKDEGVKEEVWVLFFFSSILRMLVGSSVESLLGLF
jgi:hypothetical protein